MEVGKHKKIQWSEHREN